MAGWLFHWRHVPHKKSKTIPAQNTSERLSSPGLDSKTRSDKNNFYSGPEISLCCHFNKHLQVIMKKTELIMELDT